jgi:purine-nucleoside phosphorylase
MLELVSQIEEAAAVVRHHWPRRPRIGVILGTGLGTLCEAIDAEATLAYESIPYFPRSTATGHQGKLVCGTIDGLPLVAMNGRLHAYEGYPLKQATFPVRVMKALGVELLIVSNAAGGLNPCFKNGDVMVIEDHINLLGDNPLIGINDERLGPRFPDMSEPYDANLIEMALATARREDVPLQRGVYIALTGPNLETRAEYRFLRRIGGDVVGMSTVPEVIVAMHGGGMRVLAFSIISNVCLPDALGKVSIEDILTTAAEGERKLRKIVLAMLTQLAE